MLNDEIFEKVPDYYTSEAYAQKIADSMLEKVELEQEQFLDRIIDRAQELQRRDREKVECLQIKLDEIERELLEQKAIAERADKLYQERENQLAHLMVVAEVQSYSVLRDYVSGIKKLKQDYTRALFTLQSVSGICKNHFRIHDERQESPQAPHAQ